MRLTKREIVLGGAVLGSVVCAAVELPSVGAAWAEPVMAGLAKLQWYARRHGVQTLLPAILLAAVLGAFVDRAAVSRWLGAGASKLRAYGVASVGGSAAAVCSCIVLPLFAGVYRMGAGLGPATTLLYAGPAVNVLAVLLTISVLGWPLGVGRIIAAVVFSVAIGLAMQRVFARRGEAAEAETFPAEPASGAVHGGVWRVVGVCGLLIGMVMLGNWSGSGDVRAVLLCCPDGLTQIEMRGVVLESSSDGVTLLGEDGMVREASREEVVSMTYESDALTLAWRLRWVLLAGLGGALIGLLASAFTRRELGDWVSNGRFLGAQVVPWLVGGIFLAGLLFGHGGRAGIVPGAWVERAVGGESLGACFAASLAGGLMYFATLTEIPILESLMAAGMGRGPALSLLLAGPAVSLPSLLVIASVMGWRRTGVYAGLVVVTATVAGWGFGLWWGS